MFFSVEIALIMRDIYRMTFRFLAPLVCLCPVAIPLHAEQVVVNTVSSLPDARDSEVPGYLQNISAALPFAENDANFALWLALGTVGLGLVLFWLGRRAGAAAVPPVAPRIVHPQARVAMASNMVREADAGDGPDSRYWTSLDHATTVTVDELASVEEEAEVFLLLGRMDMAIGVLRHHIESHDDARAQIWMSLLDVLHAQGLRQEFEKLAVEIRERFNVALPTWEGANARSSELTGLEHFPHLLARITSHWHDADSLAYLRSLTQDNRNGERGGFHLDAFRELLVLIGVLECREKLLTSHVLA